MNRFGGLSADEIRRVACPMCGAPAGSPCVVPIIETPREHHHKERVDLARKGNSRQRQAVDYALDAKRRQVTNRMFRP